MDIPFACNGSLWISLLLENWSFSWHYTLWSFGVGLQRFRVLLLLFMKLGGCRYTRRKSEPIVSRIGLESFYTDG